MIKFKRSGKQLRLRGRPPNVGTCREGPLKIIGKGLRKMIFTAVNQIYKYARISPGERVKIACAGILKYNSARQQCLIAHSWINIANLIRQYLTIPGDVQTPGHNNQVLIRNLV